MVLTFPAPDAERHVYTLDGRRCPSVTTIIKGGLPMPALPRWAAREVATAVAAQASTVDAVREAFGAEPLAEALAAVPWKKFKAAGARGTEIHAWAEQVVRGEPVEPPADLADAVAGYAQWLDSEAFVAELVERPIGNRACRYAGRFDLIGQLRGQRWLLDVKTGKGVYGDAALQLSAYARAEFYLDAELAERDLPPIDRIGVLHVQPELTELYDLGSIDEGFREFRAAQVIHLGDSRRRDLVKAPIQVADARALF